MYLQKFIFQVRLKLPELKLFSNDLSFHINYGEGRWISMLINVHHTAGQEVVQVKCRITGLLYIIGQMYKYKSGSVNRI